MGSPMSDYDRDVLYVTATTFKEIKSSREAGKKIAAIKTLRSATKCGLKEAKHAIERWAGERNDGPILAPCYDIVNVTLRTPDGDVTVDMEGLQLTGLMAMTTMGLDTCRAVLSLHDAIQTWRDNMGSLFFENNEEKSGTT